MKKGLIGIEDAVAAWRKGSDIDFRRGRDADWENDPFVKLGTTEGVRIELVGAGRIEFRVRPVTPRVFAIAAEVFGPNLRSGQPAEVKPEWRSVQVAIRSVREALKNLKDSISGNVVQLHVLESKVCEVEERFCGPAEVVPTPEQLGDFPRPAIGQLWQAQTMLPGRKWVDLEAGKGTSAAIVKEVGIYVHLKYPSGAVSSFNFKRFKETGEVVDKIRYRFRCIDRGVEVKKS